MKIACLHITLWATLLFGCEEARDPEATSTNNPRSTMPETATLAAYNGMPHLLDECINDGAMWRASVNPSALTGSFVECLIPFDEDNYEEGDLIPNYYKWVFDHYVVAERELKGLVAANLLHAANERGLKIDVSQEPTADEVLRQFRLSQIYLLEPEEAESGHVELSYYLGENFTGEIALIVSVDPLGVSKAGAQ